ncbi:MAG: helix-turn-helix domain-containing protein, partial [Bacteroidetes bacterium]|nr:helix-turn-helix domain-containing protein [Bacteroidota bacterium]
YLYSMQTIVALEQKDLERIIDKLDAIRLKLDRPATPQEKKWLTEEEVCEMMGVCSRTMRGYRNRAELGFAKRGRKIYYRASEIDGFIESVYVNGK